MLSSSCWTALVKNTCPWNERSLDSFRLRLPFVQSDVKRPLLSVGKLTKSGAEVKFGSKGSWIDLHTDTGMQRVPVRVKGKTVTPQAEVAPVDEEIGRAEVPNPPPAVLEAAAAPSPEEAQGMWLEREARDLAATWQSSRQLGHPLGEGGLSSGSKVEDMRNPLKTLGALVWCTKAQLENSKT